MRLEFANSAGLSAGLFRPGSGQRPRLAGLLAAAVLSGISCSESTSGAGVVPGDPPVPAVGLSAAVAEQALGDF